MATNLISFLNSSRREKSIRLFFDIETLQYNETEGYKNPSSFKNVTFSVAVSWWNYEKLDYANYSDFYSFFADIKLAFTRNDGKRYRNPPHIILVAHNGNKYDFHYLFTDLVYYFPNINIRNESLNNALYTNDLVDSPSNHIHEDKDYIFVKLLKSKSNLELSFLLYGIYFTTEDTFLKTGLSLRTIGKKLKAAGVIGNNELKTSFDYTKYNLDSDMTDYRAHEYAKECYNQLSKEELVYIRNDVILLANLYKYFDKIFLGFDYKKITFSSNVLEYYDDNELAHFQLKNKYNDMYIKYTDYQFAGQNLYDYLKSFYFGGLNFYNDKYLATIINEPVFNIDLNSSYPYTMYTQKFPAELVEFKSANKEFILNIDLSTDYYYLMQISKYEFDFLLEKIGSRTLRKMFVKYYSRLNQKYVSINSFTIRAINAVGHLNIDSLHVFNYLKFTTTYFGSRNKIADKYFVKTQGKNENKIIMHSPMDIEITKEKNDNVFSDEEKAQAKVVLNGIYGLPALRPFFHYFLVDKDGEIESYPNGYKNTERNVLFSLFVTSASFYHFINPLKYLTFEEIDNNFLYCDTDSLYFKKKVIDKIPSKILDQYKLGYWKIEHDNITRFFVLNHKKYCYLDGNKNSIELKCGGVDNNAFNKKMSFDKFIKTQFSEGVRIKNLKNIKNSQGTISLYNSFTELQTGSHYSLYMEDELRDMLIDSILNNIRKKDTLDNEDILYIESSFGTFSLNEIWNKKFPIDDKLSIYEFKQINNFIYQQLQLK